jgi:hypothetical protein
MVLTRILTGYAVIKIVSGNQVIRRVRACTLSKKAPVRKRFDLGQRSSAGRLDKSAVFPCMAAIQKSQNWLTPADEGLVSSMTSP